MDPFKHYKTFVVLLLSLISYRVHISEHPNACGCRRRRRRASTGNGSTFINVSLLQDENNELERERRKRFPAYTKISTRSDYGKQAAKKKKKYGIKIICFPLFFFSVCTIKLVTSFAEHNFSFRWSRSLFTINSNITIVKIKPIMFTNYE